MWIDSWVSKKDFGRSLEDYTFLDPVHTAKLFTEPPPGFDSFTVSTPLSEGVAGQVVTALTQWDVHRAAQLCVASTGRAEVGQTVLIGIPIAGRVMTAPCRVIAAEHGPARHGFTYATLAGHPEDGIESFSVATDEHGTRFEVSAVSRTNFRPMILVAPLARSVQRRTTSRYLAAAAAVS